MSSISDKRGYPTINYTLPARSSHGGRVIKYGHMLDIGKANKISSKKY